MLTLGIETSCDETAAAVVKGARAIKSNVIASQHDLHAEYGGVVPEIASRAHLERLVPVLTSALHKAGAEMSDIDAVAVGHRPGLIGALLVGVAAAKALAWSLRKPIVGVDHIEAHLFSPLMAREHAGRTEAETYPALGLVVSGGHTTTYLCRSPVELKRLGRTIDDAAGEAFDKAGSILGLEHPGGPKIEALAREGDDRAIDFPVSRLTADSLDFTFSGLKTAVLYAARGYPGGPAPPPLDDRRRADLAASFQRAAIGQLVLKVGRALERLDSEAVAVQSLLIGGGVSANQCLRAELQRLAERRSLALLLPPMDLCLDNAAMIAGLGARRLEAGLRDDLTLTAQPSAAA